jgi:hypothetical protein
MGKKSGRTRRGDGGGRRDGSAAANKGAMKVTSVPDDSPIAAAATTTPPQAAPGSIEYPPIDPFPPEQEFDLPKLIDSSTVTTDANDFFVSTYLVGYQPPGRDDDYRVEPTVTALNCSACKESKEIGMFTPNHWKPNYNTIHSPRCIDCVLTGKFLVTNPNKFWMGWPKDPFQILWERGWIDCQPGQQYDKTV